MPPWTGPIWSDVEPMDLSCCRCLLLASSPSAACRVAAERSSCDLMIGWPGVTWPGAVPLEELLDLGAVRREAGEQAAGLARAVIVSRVWESCGVNWAHVLRENLILELTEILQQVLIVQGLMDRVTTRHVVAVKSERPGYFGGDSVVAEVAEGLTRGRAEYSALDTRGGRVVRAAARWRWRIGGWWQGERRIQRSFVAPARRGLREDEAGSAKGPPWAVVSPCSGAEIGALAPLLEEWQSSGEFRPLLVEVPQYYAPATAGYVGRADWQGRAIQPLGAWMPREALLERGLVARELAARSLQKQEALVEALTWRGISLPDLPSVQMRLQRLTQREAPYACLAYRSAEELFRRVRPAVLVVAASFGPEMRSLMLAARAQGVPVAYLPHARHVDDPRWGWTDADLVLADGPAFAEQVIRRGQPEETVRVVGMPKHDRFVRLLAESDAAAAKGVLGLDADRDYVCLAATPELERDAAFCPAVRERLLAAAGGEVPLLVDCDPLLAFRASAVMVSGRSATGLEAMIAGTPVIYLGPREEDTYGYEESGAALAVRRPEELPAALARVLDEQGLRTQLIARGAEYAKRNFGELDGRATQRAVALIRELVDRFADRGKGPVQTGP